LAASSRFNAYHFTFIFNLARFYALLKNIKKNSNKWLVFLGLSMGLGISSKYSYALFPLVILLIVLFDSGLRRKILLIIGPAILFGLPAFLALYDILEHVKLQAGEKTQLVLGGLLRGGGCFFLCKLYRGLCRVFISIVVACHSHSFS